MTFSTYLDSPRWILKATLSFLHNFPLLSSHFPLFGPILALNSTPWAFPTLPPLFLPFSLFWPSFGTQCYGAKLPKPWHYCVCSSPHSCLALQRCDCGQHIKTSLPHAPPAHTTHPPSPPLSSSFSTSSSSFSSSPSPLLPHFSFPVRCTSPLF